MERYSKYLNIELLEGEYDEGSWLKAVKHYSQATEKSGLRCKLCFEMRLRKTAELTKEKGYDSFTTTLSVSPYKNVQAINDIGLKVQGETGINYLEADFKKDNGYKRSIEMSKEFGLYRQNYCGCVYSIKDNQVTGPH